MLTYFSFIFFYSIIPLPILLSIKTVLHCAARGGHTNLLRYLLHLWMDDKSIRSPPAWRNTAVKKGIVSSVKTTKINSMGKADIYDRWFRTPVHWCVLHGHVDALRVLLHEKGGGCSPSPPVPKVSISGRFTNAVIETPIEICNRLYQSGSHKVYNHEQGKGDIGRNIRLLLLGIRDGNRSETSRGLGVVSSVSVG